MATVLRAKLDMEQGERRERVVNSELALNAENLRQLQRKGQFEQEQHEKMSRPQSIVPMLDSFYGGAEGAMGQWALKQMRRNGWIEDVAGEPTSNGYNLVAARKRLEEDENLQAQMMQVGIDSARKNRDEIREQLKNKPDGDEKLTAELQRHQQALDTFIAGMKEVNNKFQSKEEIAAAQKREDFVREDQQAHELQKQRARGPLVSQTINTGDISPKTTSALEEEIVHAEKTIEMINRVKELYKREYLQYQGKGQAWLENKLSKAGLSEGEFAAARQTWAYQIDIASLMFRKLITGVAGGEKEMEMIERIALNTKFDSPAQHEAKMALMPVLAEAAKKRSEYLLKKGFPRPQEATPEAKADAAKMFPFPALPKELASGKGAAPSTAEEKAKENPDYEKIIKKYPYLAPGGK
jgi:rRNA processing protein Gar1